MDGLGYRLSTGLGQPRITSMKDPVAEAEAILDEVWAQMVGGRHIPVDPVKIANRLGFDVLEIDLEPQVSGAIIKKVGDDPAIYLSRTDSPNRQRFTAAHELGHYVQRSDDEDDFEWVDYRDELAGAGVNPAEIFGNQFAANLLMPAREVGQAHRRGLTPVAMAFEFGVSTDAMTFRLKNLRLI